MYRDHGTKDARNCRTVACLKWVDGFVVFIKKLDVKCLCEVVAKVVCGGQLDYLSIRHQGICCIGVEPPGKLVPLCTLEGHNRETVLFCNYFFCSFQILLYLS